MMQPQTNAPKNAHLAYNYAAGTVNKTRQVVMAYDGILSMVARARQAIEENDAETRFNSIEKACAVIIGLQAALDHTRGGEIAKLLDQFYFGIDIRLMRQNREPDLKMLDRIINEIRLMRDAWADVDTQIIAASIVDAEVIPTTPSAETINSISVSA